MSEKNFFGQERNNWPKKKAAFKQRAAGRFGSFRQCGEKDQLAKRLHVGKHHTCQECCCNWSCSSGDQQKLSTIQQKRLCDLVCNIMLHVVWPVFQN